MSQLDQPLLGHRAAPGEGTGCAHLCHLPQGWLLFALDFSLSVVIGRTQDDYRGCQGTRYMGVGAENSPALPRSAVLASQREGLLRAEHLSFLSELWPDTCSAVKDETPEAEVGGVRGGVCPHTPLLGAKPCGSFLARPRLQRVRVKTSTPVLLVKLFLFLPKSRDPPLSPRTEGDNKATCSVYHDTTD